MLHGLTFDSKQPVKHVNLLKVTLSRKINKKTNCSFCTSLLHNIFKINSEDTDVTGTFSFSDERIDIPLVQDIKESDFISCIYDNHWWISLVQPEDF